MFLVFEVFVLKDLFLGVESRVYVSCKNFGFRGDSKLFGEVVKLCI